MSLSINGSRPVGFASSPSTTSPNGGASFEQLLNQVASNYGISPQELFNLITSSMNPAPGGGGFTPAPGGGGFTPAPGGGAPAPVSGGGGGGGSSAEMKEILGQFAVNTFNSGQGMMKQAMENFFKEEEPDEDDPDAEPL